MGRDFRWNVWKSDISVQDGLFCDFASVLCLCKHLCVHSVGLCIYMRLCLSVFVRVNIISSCSHLCQRHVTLCHATQLHRLRDGKNRT